VRAIPFSAKVGMSGATVRCVSPVTCREFKCIGDKPPQDHPHIYLTVGETGEIICPYCSTLFRYDPSLGEHEADPADCAYGDAD
jgi:uncharacterized Zn-finger protein